MSLQFYPGLENIPNLTFTTTTIVLPSSYLGKQTYVVVGGQAYKNLSAITLDMSLTGTGNGTANRIDTGTIAANTLYYVFAVVTNNALGLTASLNSSAPTGFSAYKAIGRFRTFTGSATIAAIVTRFDNVIRPTADLEWQTFPVYFSGTGSGYAEGNAIKSGRYKRIDDSMEVRITFTAGSTTNWGSSGLHVWGLPVGFTTAASKLDFTPTGKLCTVGSAIALDASPGAYYYGNVSVYNVGGANWLEVVGGTAAKWGVTYPITWAINDEISIEAIVPITEFAGLYT